ncbi:MAG: MBL fold metallo-hydrolase [Acidobacteriota bacterium]|nr:MBL fold metallo-hydrolase [Acidobacteriota bacterium]
MTESARRHDHGRGERVARGIYRLRLPLPFPGVPHCNAWALAGQGGVVLVDTGMHEPDSMEQLERAMAMCDLKVEQVRLVVCTHAHLDHCGQAGPIMERAGCGLMMHPNPEHMRHIVQDPQAVLMRQLEVARASGVPEEALRRYAEARSAQRANLEPVPEPDELLLAGTEIETDLGTWITYETPGHAPSHVCLYQPERRLLISGDHVLGRTSLYFDYGYTPDPVGEYLVSLDRVAHLDARLCLAGHGRTFADVAAHIESARDLVHERLAAVLAALAGEPLSAFDIVPHVYGQSLSQVNAHWLLSKVLCYLTHLEAQERVARIPGDPERWRSLADDAARAGSGAGSGEHAGSGEP